jgi:hypothetical protein
MPCVTEFSVVVGVDGYVVVLIWDWSDPVGGTQSISVVVGTPPLGNNILGGIIVKSIRREEVIE